jgi:hypothetical protein
MRLFNGQLVVTLRSARQQGTMTLTVSDPKRNIQQRLDIEVR